MKKEWVWLIVLAICVIILLPWSVLKWQKEKKPTGDFAIRVMKSDGKIEKMVLEEYLVGVVAAEMPAEFEPEALKAQAVAARTYAAKRLSKPAIPDIGYDVDTTTQTQAWLSNEQMREKWGWFDYWRNRFRIQKAVTATRAEVLVSNGEYIDAYYHSSSGRLPTERSEDVWSSSRTYLKNVASEEENPLRIVKHSSFTPLELSQRLNFSQHFLSFGPADFKVISRTAAGRVKELQIKDKTFTGTNLRILLGLASTDIEWAIKSNQIIFTTFGNGHAVGMSQYGANDMAKKGRSYLEILGHYYPGAKLLTLSH